MNEHEKLQNALGWIFEHTEYLKGEFANALHTIGYTDEEIENYLKDECGYDTGKLTYEMNAYRRINTYSYPKQPLPYPCNTCKYKEACGSPRTEPCKGYERKKK